MEVTDQKGPGFTLLLQGTSKIRQIATLNEAGNAYSGSGNFDVYDGHGNVILSGTFTIQATRVRVETPS